MKSKKEQLQVQEIILYPVEEGKYQIALSADSESIWLNLNQIAELYQTSIPNISMHIRNILKEGELNDWATVKYYLTVQSEQGRNVRRNIAFYSLDMILSIGFRVRSERGTQFRIWAIQHLSEYLKKGFLLDDERLKGNNRLTDYFDELLARIREIRASEARAYQRVRELFSLAADYRPGSEAANLFFATMQNKMLFAATGHTAAELVSHRADSSEPNMGLTSWKGSRVRKADVGIARNYLQAEEIDILNLIVNMWLDRAEFKLRRRQKILTKSWETNLDKFLLDNELPILSSPGRTSHDKARAHAEKQYQAYDQIRRAETEKEAETKYLADLTNSAKTVAARRKKK
ncbi:MAG: virulence RhuM family protein [Candidatus Syntrophosphaera sp.]|nr:virulence RhuM family protein [Candidatus Syntrophosphaera sp.]